MKLCKEVWYNKKIILERGSKMAYSPEYKKDIQKRLQKESVTQVAKESGVSKATLYKWKKERQEETNQEEVKKQSTSHYVVTKNENIRQNRYYSAGMKAYKEKRWREAIQYLEKSIKEEGEYYRAVFTLGKCYSRIKKKHR